MDDVRREWGAVHPDSGRVWGFGQDETGARQFATDYGTSVMVRRVTTTPWVDEPGRRDGIEH